MAAGDTLYRRLREAVRDLPAPNRLLQSVDAVAARSERVALQYARALTASAEALTATLRPQLGSNTVVPDLKLDADGAGPAATTWRPQPPAGQLTQVVPPVVATWSYQDVNTALDAHEFGQFMDSCVLADAFGRDDRITGCLGTRVRALAGKSGVGFTVEPSSHGDPQRCAAWAKEINDLWYYTCPESVMSHILRDAVLFGVAFARIHWEIVGNRRVPRLEPWDMRGVFWDWGIRQYRAIALEGLFTIDRHSAEWLVFEPAGPWRSWMWGAIRGLGRPWLIRQFTFRDWARYSEKHGIPILAVKEPQGHQWERQKAGFWARMRRIGHETTLRLPRDDKDYGFEVELIEAKARSEDAFKKLIERLDSNIAVMLLGQNLSTEVQGGSRAAAQAHELVRLDYLDADAQTLSTALREQVWKAFLRFNGEGNVDEEEAPWPTWATRPPQDKVALAGVVQQVFAALTQGAGVGITLPRGWTDEKLGIPIIGLPDVPAGLQQSDGGPNAAAGEDSGIVDAEGNPVGTNKMPAPVQQPGAGGKGVEPPAAQVAQERGLQAKQAAQRQKAERAAEQASISAARVVALAANTMPVRTIGGIDVTIDRPAGTVQTGTAPDGTPWSRTYTTDYGFVAGTLGGDGDELDVFCGPDEDAENAYLIAQTHADGTFDEWKLMLGFPDQGDAIACYVAHVPMQYLGRVVTVPVAAVRGLLGYEPRVRQQRLSVLWRVGKRITKAA